MIEFSSLYRFALPLACQRTSGRAARLVREALTCALLLTCMFSGLRGQDSDEYFVLASAHYRRGQWKQAIENFEKLIEQFPGDERVPTAIFYLGEAQVQTGDYGQAKQQFEKFVKLAGPHAFVRRAEFRIGETSYLDGQYEAAYLYFSDFVKKYPDDQLLEYVLPYLGQMEVDRGELDKGLERFEQALSRFPNGVLADQCRFGLGRALKSSDPEQAERFFVHVGERGKAAWADDAILELGKLHFQAGEYDAASKWLSSFTDKYANSELVLDGLYWYGRSLARAEKYSAAQRIFSQVIGADPSQDLAPALYFEAAVVARQLEQTDESSRLLQQLLEAFPDSEWADESLLLLAQNEYQAKRHIHVVQQADLFLKKFSASEFRGSVLELKGKSLLSLEQYPESADVFQQLLAEADAQAVNSTIRANWNYLLGLSWFRAAQTEQALAAFDQAAKLSDNSALLAAVNLAKSTIYIGQNQYAEAVAPLQAYLETSQSETNNIQVRAELARAYAQAGKFHEADELLEQLAEDPAGQALCGKTASALAENAYQQRQFEYAVKWFEKLTEPGNEPGTIARGLSGMAWSLAEDNRKEEAVAVFAKLIGRYPHSELADEAILKRGILLAEMQRIDEALQTFCQFEKAYRDSPLWPDAVLNLARVTQQRHTKADLELAADQIQTLMDTRQQLQEDDKFLYQLAWLRNDLGDQHRSERIFKQISTNYKSSKYWADASYRVAEIAVREHRWEEAKQVLDQLIDADAETNDLTAHGLYLQGKIGVDQGDWPNAERFMDQLVQKYPDHELRLAAEYWRAEAAYRQKDYPKAEDLFTSLQARISADQEEDLLANVMLRRAQLRAKQDSWQEAYALAAAFVEQFPDHASRYEADYIIGRYYAREGKFNAARESFARVLEQRAARGTETAAIAQFMIGESYCHQEDFEQATKAYHKAEILHPYPQWQAAALLQCGKCYESQSDWQEAAACYERLLKDFSETEFSGEANGRLQAVNQRQADEKN